MQKRCQYGALKKVYGTSFIVGKKTFIKNVVMNTDYFIYWNQ